MGRTNQEEANLNKELYFSNHYLRREQLSSYSTQIMEVSNARPATMLEIGKGSGFVSDYFVKAGVDVTTFDINSSLNPDICGTIFELGKLVKGRKYDVVLCAEVLEHIPFEEFNLCLEQIAIVSGGRVVISLPTCKRSPFDFSLALKIPFIKRFHLRPYLPIRTRQIAAEHHWEVDSSTATTKAKIIRMMEKLFIVKKVYLEFLNPYHLFFILEKPDNCSPKEGRGRIL